MNSAFPPIPSFIILEQRAKKNIEKMARKAEISGVRFRPHFKTHQSAEVSAWFREAGVGCATVSSAGMAAFFADAGWNDLTIAFPVNVLESEQIGNLASRISLSVLVEDPFTIRELARRLASHPGCRTLGLWIKVDTGYHRTGIDFRNHQKIAECLSEASRHPLFTIKGLLTHAGHSYLLHDKKEKQELFRTTAEKMSQLRNSFSHEYSLEISVGDTPTCTAADSFKGVDEVRPGNFVYFDAQQLALGSCGENEIAAVITVPVAAVHEDRKKIIIYGGAVHLSKQEHEEGHFGYAVTWNGSSPGHLDRNNRLVSLSQEHGIVKIEGSFPRIDPGDLMAIIPVHSCLAANLLKDQTIIISGEV
jgi:D-serine deaminase-like pyridoxal phosphate-dependent protein